jgi:hypothetical protein
MLPRSIHVQQFMALDELAHAYPCLLPVPCGVPYLSVPAKLPDATLFTTGTSTLHLLMVLPGCLKAIHIHYLTATDGSAKDTSCYP